ncbi:MAG TPA: hypothetical protein VLL05_05230 [Terriglobales bacterium]|nr:hypothetical protein [Terriglobales bacterium]
MHHKWLVFSVLAGIIGVGSGLAQEVKPSSSLTPANKTDPNAVITNESLPSGARIYIAPMINGFETYVVAGLEKKKVPVVVVTDPGKADYELSGVSDSDKAGWAKMLFLGSQQTNENASIKIVNLKTGDIVFAYSVNKMNSYKGKQSAGESVAKHINEKIENRYHCGAP